MRLINGDCLEEMDKLINEGVKVDAIITDPPYGTTSCKWDSIIPFDEMWERLKLLRKDRTPVVLFGSEPFSSNLRMSNIKEYKYDWIWNKVKAGNIFLAKTQPMKIHEIISVFYNGTYNRQMIKRDKIKKSKNYGTGQAIGGNYKKEEKIYTYTHKNPTSIIKFSNANQNGKVHPTQKPVKLLEYLIKTYTNEGDTVLDFTMGSGTTGVACKKLNRDFIGIELDERYYNISKDRIGGVINEL
jgi:site-specific DNA-methyltransferase (adenine-specific)